MDRKLGNAVMRIATLVALEQMGIKIPAPLTASVDLCRVCGGNDGDTPCAYPSEGKVGCLRDARLSREDSTS